MAQMQHRQPRLHLAFLFQTPQSSVIERWPLTVATYSDMQGPSVTSRRQSCFKFVVGLKPCT